jgi:hypothetical protein
MSIRHSSAVRRRATLVAQKLGHALPAGELAVPAAAATEPSPQSQPAPAEALRTDPQHWPQPGRGFA